MNGEGAGQTSAPEMEEHDASSSSRATTSSSDEEEEEALRQEEETATGEAENDATAPGNVGEKDSTPFGDGHVEDEAAVAATLQRLFCNAA